MNKEVCEYCGMKLEGTWTKCMGCGVLIKHKTESYVPSIWEKLYWPFMFLVGALFLFGLAQFFIQYPGVK